MQFLLLTPGVGIGIQFHWQHIVENGLSQSHSLWSILQDKRNVQNFCELTVSESVQLKMSVTWKKGGPFTQLDDADNGLLMLHGR